MLGFYFFAMVLVNVFITLPSAEKEYAGMADLTWPGFDWIPNLLTAALVVWLLRREHDRSFPQVLGVHRSGPGVAHE